MKVFILVFSITLISLSSEAARKGLVHSATISIPEKKVIPSVEISDLVEAVSEAPQSWSFSKFNVPWKTEGAIEETHQKKRVYSRQGEVELKLAGKVLPSEFMISLYGPKEGFTSIEIVGLAINHEIETQVTPEKLTNSFESKSKSIKKIKCDSFGSASELTTIYEIAAQNKKPIWLQFNKSCGSHGCSVGFTIFISKSEVDAQVKMQPCPP